MGNASGHAWIWIVHIRSADGEKHAAFVIDERDYPNSATAQGAIDQMSIELERQSLSANYEHIRVRLDEPAPDLPTWSEYPHRFHDTSRG